MHHLLEFHIAIYRASQFDRILQPILPMFVAPKHQFLEGSLGGVFEHVFYMVGQVQKRKATFTSGFYSALLISHFLTKKEKGQEVVYAVLEVPNKPKWVVWVRIEEAIKSNEVEIRPSK